MIRIGICSRSHPERANYLDPSTVLADDVLGLQPAVKVLAGIAATGAGS